jgi:hypothetical protein
MIISRKRKKNSKNQASLRWGILFLLGLGFLLGLALFIKNSQESLWDGKSRLSLIQLSDTKIELINLIPEERKKIIWEIDPTIKVEVPFGYGEYQFNKVYNLGELDQIGGPLLLRTASNFFGIPITAYRVGRKTNLSWWDEIRFKWQDLLDLNQEVTQDLTLKVAQINQVVNEVTFDPEVAKEEIKIAVINATGKSGEASNIARMLTNRGAQVVNVGNTQTQEESQLIIVSADLTKSKVFSLVKKIIGPAPVLVSNQANQYRADLLLIVGVNYTKLLP